MLQPTRTNLLNLREKAASVSGSIEMLKGRRRALIGEFLKATVPFLRTRQEVRGNYGRAITELALSIGHEGRASVESIALDVKKGPSVEVAERRLWGLRYRDIEAHETAARSPSERGYDYRHTTPHMEAAMHLFERLADSMVQVAAYESKLKRLAEEIRKTTRRTRVLEERVLPRIKGRIRGISQYIEEREREAFCRLKRVKTRLENRRLETGRIAR